MDTLDSGLEIKSIPRGRVRLFEYLRTAFALARELTHWRGDGLLYVQGGNALLITWWAFLVFSPRRIVYHTQEFFEPGRHGLWSWLEKICCRRAGLVVSNDAGRARVLASLARLRTMPLVVRTALPAAWPREDLGDETIFQPLRRLRQARPDAVLVMHAGMLSGARCGQELLTAIALLPPHYVVVVTGANAHKDGEPSESF